MASIDWMVIGLVVGFVGSKVVNKKGKSIIGDLLLGVVGALLGGWLLQSSGKITQPHPIPDLPGLDMESALAAVVGAVVVLFAYDALRRG